MIGTKADEDLHQQIRVAQLKRIPKHPEDCLQQVRSFSAVLAKLLEGASAMFKDDEEPGVNLRKAEP